jgi:hypothetical protein
MQKCPFEAIQIINLPKDLDKDTTHRYGPNTFKLHRSVSCFTLQSSVGGQYVLALGMIVICIPDFMFCYAVVGRLLSNEELFRCDSTVLIVLLLLQVACSKAWSSLGAGGNKWYWQVNCT